MLPVSVILLCVALATSLTVIGVYVISFFKFVHKDNKERREQELNETVDRILKHKEMAKHPQVIDITDYMEHPPVYTERDALLDDLSSRSLTYADALGLWIKTK